MFHQETFATAPSLPIPTSSIILFIAYLEMKHLSRNTAHTYLSALGHPHILAGLSDSMVTLAKRKMIESVGKNSVSLPDCKPVTWAMLSAALTVIARHHPHWEATLYRALLSMTFHLCVQVVSTHHTIRPENTLLSPTLVQINFLTFKHRINIKTCSRVLEADHSPLCLVSLLGAYLHIRPGPATGPLSLNKNVTTVLHPPDITPDCGYSDLA